MFEHEVVIVSFYNWENINKLSEQDYEMKESLTTKFFKSLEDFSCKMARGGATADYYYLENIKKDGSDSYCLYELISECFTTIYAMELLIKNECIVDAYRLVRPLIENMANAKLLSRNMHLVNKFKEIKKIASESNFMPIGEKQMMITDYACRDISIASVNNYLQYGWAETILNDRITASDVIRAAGLNRIRDMYYTSSRFIHSNIDSTSDELEFYSEAEANELVYELCKELYMVMRKRHAHDPFNTDEKFRNKFGVVDTEKLFTKVVNSHSKLYQFLESKGLVTIN